MKHIRSRLLALVATTAAALAICNAEAEQVPENNYQTFKTRIQPQSKDVSDIRAWLEMNLMPGVEEDAMLSPQCRQFLDDFYKSTSPELDDNQAKIAAQKLRKKWGGRFDLTYPWEHVFETGNCGWGTRKLTDFEYLGELNGGDWFRLTLKGGCGKNDFSETVVRVVKVVSKNGEYQITNFLSL